LRLFLISKVEVTIKSSSIVREVRSDETDLGGSMGNFFWKLYRYVVLSLELNTLLQ